MILRNMFLISDPSTPNHYEDPEGNLMCLIDTLKGLHGGWGQNNFSFYYMITKLLYF